MNRNYSYLSEIARNGQWMMHPDAFNMYQEVVLNAISIPGMQTDWAEKRENSKLLVYHDGVSRPEEKMIQTSDVFRSEKWPGISSTDQVVHILPVSGPVTHGGAPCAYGTRDMADRFMYADSHPNVVGHLVILDTPGGEAGANDLDAAFKNARKPVVGLIRGMNASKGVWISSFIPHVFAERPDVEIGCIGAMWNIRGMRDGVNRDNIVSYQVYADNSIHKNGEVREAVQNDNLKPAIEELNKIDEEFRSIVKSRWPNVAEDKLTGRMYKASEVIGEMVDGIKSYDESINLIFELAGVKRATSGIITPDGVLETEEIDEDDNQPDPDDPYETTQSATGTEEPVQTNNTNPQKLLIPMANKELLEAIPGMGAVAVDESGNASLTAEQYEVLNNHLLKGNAALKLADTQMETITGLQQKLTEKDGVIQELAQATGKPIQQPAPLNDNAVEQPVNKVKLVTSETASHYDNINKMREYMSQHGMI